MEHHDRFGPIKDSRLMLDYCLLTWQLPASSRGGTGEQKIALPLRQAYCQSGVGLASPSPSSLSSAMRPNDPSWDLGHIARDQD